MHRGWYSQFDELSDGIGYAFRFAMLERCCRGKAVYLQALAAMVCLMIEWTYVISSNKTYRC